MQTILKVQINLCSSDSGQTSIHEINIPLAHYFPSNPTDTSCSASQRTNQRSSRWSGWEQTPSHPPHTPFRRPFCLPLFSLCLAGDEYSTPPLLQWAARNARVNKNSWQMSFLQHLLRGEPFISQALCVWLAYTTSCQNKDWPQHTSWHWGVFASLYCV